MLSRLSLVSVGLVATFSLVTAGCPDPTASPGGTDQPMSFQAPPAGGGAPGEGVPGGAGGPGGPGGPGAGGGRPNPPGFQVTAGEGVKVSGTIAYAGTKTGTITVDFLRQGTANTFPELVHSLSVDKAGPFEIEAPKDAGDLWIVAFIDSNSNGPDPTEPAGRALEVVSVKQAPIAGISITITDEPDLGQLKPGGEGEVPAGGAAVGEGKGAPPMPGKAGEGGAPGGMVPGGGAPGGPGMPPGGAKPPEGAGAPPAGTNPGK